MKKLLSHRLRGLSDQELTLSALRRACTENIPYLEIDTRVSGDGTIVVYHHARTDADLARKIRLKDCSWDEIASLHYAHGEGIPKLDSFLAHFAELSQPFQQICIDIKDIGHEKQHVELIRKHRLERRVIIVSWAPQVLYAINELAPELPLIFSHWNFSFMGPVGSWISSFLKNAAFKLFWFVVLGRNQSRNALENRTEGFQHVMITVDLPTSLSELLENSGGGICVHHSNLCHRLAQYCRTQGLALWVFSARNQAHFQKLSQNDSVNVIFVDNFKEMNLPGKSDV